MDCCAGLVFVASLVVSLWDSWLGVVLPSVDVLVLLGLLVYLIVLVFCCCSFGVA